MIASSSMTLESLKITPKVGFAHRTWGDAPHPASGEVQKIPTGRLTGNCVLPGLTKLILGAQNVALSASCVRTFPNLTQLEIYSFISGNVSPSFWDALGSAGTLLQSLSIFPIDEPVSKYLASYSGLKTLRVCHLPGHPAPTLEIGKVMSKPQQATFSTPSYPNTKVRFGTSPLTI
ncbi:hypothetical protein FA13DRAFT_373624 [Coprinellus micaceus]|uniref:Uncharacterized protein n=1 Tax=Coprinellus micaceus TaxID=71717 RepID=A0A4Y7SD78_COPMI|nr:hypothetical protein FA13DRAFT_373624 [Coprinellus micaceus]